MSESSYPRILFSERLSTGIVVHFEMGEPVFFPAAFLYEQRAAQSNIFVSDDEGGDDAANRMVGESHTPSSTESTPKQKDQKSNQPKILVVDANERVRTSLGKVLAINQFQITTAANVGEALHLIQAEPFDVLLSEMRMTEADEKFSLVKAMHSKNPDAVTMAYIGYSELEQALNAVLLPANAATVKPMAIATLVSLVQTHTVHSLPCSERSDLTSMSRASITKGLPALSTRALMFENSSLAVNSGQIAESLFSNSQVQCSASDP